MLKPKLRRWFLSILAILSVVFLSFGVWVFGTSSKFQTCNANQTAAESHASKKQLPPSGFARVLIYSRCAGHTAYEYRDAAIAVATVFIAIFTAILGIFTISLARSTRIAADAAQRQATTAIGVELPTLMLFHFDFGDMGAASGDAILQSPLVTASVKNYGRTPAFVISQAVDFEWNVWPEKPDYSRTAEDMAAETVIEAGGIHKLRDTRPGRFLSGEEISAINEGKGALFAYGYIAYRDFLRQPHILRFSRRLIVGFGDDGKAFRWIDAEGEAPRAFTESW